MRQLTAFGRARTTRRLAFGALAGAASLVLTACPPSGGGPGPTTTTTTIDPANNLPPVISSFGPSRATAPSPLTTAFQWTISDPNGQPLTCGLDLDDNGTFEVTVNSCTTASVRAATFTDLGTHTVTLRVSDGLLTVTDSTTVTVTTASSDPFDVTVRINGSMTPSQQAAFTTAAARWAEAIRTGLTSSTLDIGADDCGTGAPAFNGTIDDVLIDASIAAIDGVSGILGQAGPCYTRISNGLPLYGVMKFDSADVADMQADGTFDDVILHEMGHVLGIGTVWNSPLLTGSGTSNPVFTGAVARGAWQAIGGTGNVPVENSGGAGTANSHWRETTFNAELMTGYIDAGSNPMSAITVGSLADLGYGVDLGAADPYGLPGLRAAPATAPRKITTQVIRPKGQR